MLLPYTTLEYYGPGATAMVADSGVGGAVVQPVMRKRTAVNAGGVGAAVTLRPYRGRYFAITAGGAGALVCQARKRVRPALAVSVGGALTQDGVTGAVLEANVANGLSLKAAINLLLANMVGGGSTLTAAEIAAAVRAEITTELSRVDVAVSSRATPAQVDAAVEAIPAGTAPPTAGEVAASVWSLVSRTLTSEPPPSIADITQALVSEVLPVNAVQMNNTEIIGTGISTDKFRGVGEPA